MLERSEDLSVESEAETPGPPEVPPGEARCDLLAQEGCGDAERCVPTLDAGTRCVAAGEGSEGEGCSRVAACAAGLLCAQEGPDEAGRCRRICGEGVPCDPGGRCVGSPGLRDAGLCLSDP